MNKDELGRLYPVIITDYDRNWPVLFDKEKRILTNLFVSNLRIEHIGSTAVTGLSAKPTIDILIEKPDNINDDQIIRTMTGNEYIHMIEQTQHLMFVKGYSATGLEKESYHIHMGPLDQDWLWDRIYFRDYLRKNLNEAQTYEKMKRKLSIQYRNDRDAYTEAKTEYIRIITQKAKDEMQYSVL